MEKEFNLNRLNLKLLNRPGHWISVDIDDPANQEYLNDTFMNKLDTWVKENNIRAHRMSFAMWRFDSKHDLSAFIFYIGK